MRTLTLENDKLVKFTETSAKKIESNMAIVSREIESLELKYPGVKTATITKARDQGKARPWLDSLQQQLFRLKEIDTAFGTMYENSKFNSVLTDVSYLNYLMRFNAEVIKFNSHVNNSQIAEIDSVICERSAHSIMLYKDSVRLEVINNNVIGIVKKAKLYTRSAMTEYKSSKRSDSNPNDILQIQNELLSILELAQKVNMNCLNFNK